MDRVELLPNSEQIALHCTCTLSNEKEWEQAVALSESRRLDVDILCVEDGSRLSRTRATYNDTGTHYTVIQKQSWRMLTLGCLSISKLYVQFEVIKHVLVPFHRF
jgi:hypothetical protein